MASRVSSLAVFSLSFTSVNSVFFCLHLTRRRLRSGRFLVLPARAAYFFFSLFPVPLSPLIGCDFLVTFPCSWHALQTSSSSFAPILGFGSCASPRSLASSGLTATFWSSSSPSRHFRAASCSTSRLFCSSNSILW